MKNKTKAIIIGSGTSAIKYKFGDIINSYDFVVRFLGYEKRPEFFPCIGNKIDLFSFSGHEAGIAVFKILLDRNTVPCDNLFIGMNQPAYKNIATIDKLLSGSKFKYYIYKLDDVDRLRKEMNLGNYYPSSGSMMIDYMIQQFGQVTIHGFDLAEDNFDIVTQPLKHFFEERHLPKHFHDFAKESSYIKNMILSGKIFRLTDIVDDKDNYAIANSDLLLPRTVKNKTLWNNYSSEVVKISLLVRNNFSMSFAIMADTVSECINSGGKVIIFGLGSNAATSQHLVSQLTTNLFQRRKPIAAISLSSDVSVLTACESYFGKEMIFSRQIEALGKSCDVAIGLSSESNDVTAIGLGLQQARNMGMKTIVLSGPDGHNVFSHMSDIIFNIPTSATPIIQEMHLMIGHSLIASLEIINHNN